MELVLMIYIKINKLQNLIRNSEKINDLKVNILLQGSFEYRLIEMIILELKRRNIKKVSRVWKCKNWSEFESRSSSGFFRIENGYTVKDYFENLENLVKIIPQEYFNLISKFSIQPSLLQHRNKYIFAFTYESDFEVYSYLIESDKFEVIVDNKICHLSDDERHDLFRNYKAVSLRSGIHAHVFDLNFPLLKYIIALLYEHIAEKNSINIEKSFISNSDYLL